MAWPLEIYGAQNSTPHPSLLRTGRELHASSSTGCGPPQSSTFNSLGPQGAIHRISLSFDVTLTHDIFNQRSGTVIAMAITGQTQRATFPLTMELNKVRLPKRWWVKIRQIRTLSVDRLGRRLGRVTPEELDRLVDGLNEIVGS